jgi:hypothetical protein
MTVPQPSFGPTGFVAPAESDILTAVKAEINAAFDNDLNMADETPQGQIAVSQAAAIGNANDSFVFLSNQFDPALNSGRYQDAIGRIYYISRIAATATAVNVTVGGLSGVVIPANSLVVDAAGNLYASSGSITIPASGTIIAEFLCTTLGPIACPAGSITTIYQAINGWDTATNAADGVVGLATETSQQFEQRRRLSTAANAQGSLPAVLGAILTTSGVTDAFVTENVLQTPQVIGGFTLNPNSLFASVVGGADSDVAHALWTKKSPGCGYNGSTTVVVQDTNSGYSPPLPSYNVSFVRPSFQTVTFQVTIFNSLQVPANALALIQASIVNSFNGLDGGPRARIGSTIFASRFYGGVAALGTWAQIVNIKIGCDNQPAATFVGSISGSTLTVSSVTSGVIATGQQITGNGVLPGTTITSGASLSWTVTNTQTVGSGTMFGVVAILDEIPIDIDQSPVTAAGNTALTLV